VAAGARRGDRGTLEPLTLKGKSLPVAAYRLLQVRSDMDSRARLAATPLVGRQRQLRVLGDAYANVVGERSCGLLTVLGTAGVGKSRLAAEFLRGIEATVLAGTCLSYGQGITYWPVVSVVKQLLDAEHGGTGAAELMARDAKVAAAVKVLLGEQAAVTSPSEIAWAVRKLFESCADRAPLVVLFDDLHWAEPALLIWSSTSRISAAARPSCLSAWRGPNCSTAGQGGAAAS
jgi:hypothetical protein